MCIWDHLYHRVVYRYTCKSDTGVQLTSILSNRWVNKAKDNGKMIFKGKKNSSCMHNPTDSNDNFSLHETE